jgi:hypothetical protein
MRERMMIEVVCQNCHQFVKLSCGCCISGSIIQYCHLPTSIQCCHLPTSIQCCHLPTSIQCCHLPPISLRPAIFRILLLTSTLSYLAYNHSQLNPFHRYHPDLHPNSIFTPRHCQLQATIISNRQNCSDKPTKKFGNNFFCVFTSCTLFTLWKRFQPGDSVLFTTAHNSSCVNIKFSSQRVARSYFWVVLKILKSDFVWVLFCDRQAQMWSLLVGECKSRCFRRNPAGDLSGN